jgi:hypothetical protein
MDVNKSSPYNQIELRRILPSFFEGTEDFLDCGYTLWRMAVLHQPSNYLWTAGKDTVWGIRVELNPVIGPYEGNIEWEETKDQLQLFEGEGTCLTRKECISKNVFHTLFTMFA